MRSRFWITILAAVFWLRCGSLQAKTIKVGAQIKPDCPASSWGQFHEKGQRDYFRYVNES